MSRVPFIHQTDLFRPHEDPDDHYDLACAYSLHQAGRLDLRGIIIDHPPPHHAGIPDVAGIEMLNHVTGLDIPCAVGQKTPMLDSQGGEKNDAVDFLVKVLDESESPVVINLVGSCRDVAIALRDNRDLFRDKCKAIFLNAGTGYTPTANGDELEYNVRLDIAAYASLLDAPCPVNWFPCFERLGVNMMVHEHGTWYVFGQGTILPDLEPALQAYFAYMFSRDQDPDWRKWLDPARVGPVIDEQSFEFRPMWSTAGMLQAAGVSMPEVFSLAGVAVVCTPEAYTTWMPDDSSSIQLFRIEDQDRYRERLPEALRALMLDLRTLSI